MKRFILFCLGSSFVLSSFLAAAELKAVRIKEAPKIDGVLSDSVWQAAAAVTNFRMVEPQPNQEPTEKTELRILYDEANLYIGILCYDSDPRRIAANTMAHERPMRPEPRTAVFIAAPAHLCATSLLPSGPSTVPLAV